MAKLSTAIELDAATRNKIIEMLQQQMKVKIELESIVKPDLIGGFVLSVEDRQLDASILKKIKKLTREFKVNVYQKKI
jgi:F-type H+-transporting ATPase subunit delta